MTIKKQSVTIVRKRPNSLSRSTRSPSLKMNCDLRSFLQTRIIAICWAATERTGSSIRLNSSKQPQEPDCARPINRIVHIHTRVQIMMRRSDTLQLHICKTKYQQADSRVNKRPFPSCTIISKMHRVEYHAIEVICQLLW